MSDFITWDYDEAWRHFKTVFEPIENKDNPTDEFDGLKFEVDDALVEIYRTQKPGNIWTIIETENSVWIASGYHFVNREGYILTTHEFPKEMEVLYMHIESEEEDEEYENF